METKEIWIKIVDFPDYSISSFGRVKSFKKYAKLKERILKPQISKKRIFESKLMERWNC